MREQLDLLGQRFRLDLQLIELSQHQLLRPVAPRFFLPFAHDDIAQHFVFLGQARGLFRIRAGGLGLSQLRVRFFQLRAQLADVRFVIRILFLAGRELLAQLLDLPFHVGDLLLFLRFIVADFADLLFRLG